MKFLAFALSFSEPDSYRARAHAHAGGRLLAGSGEL